MCTASVVSGKTEAYLCYTGGNLYWTCQECRHRMRHMVCIARELPVQ